MPTAIDLFAGLGGWSSDARNAGIEVPWAANHWPVAVEWHSVDHPEAIHICQDLHKADWSKVPAHDIILASPCCQGHSKASGKVTYANDTDHCTDHRKYIFSQGQVHIANVKQIDIIIHS